jgi:hypothetical protein
LGNDCEEFKDMDVDEESEEEEEAVETPPTSPLQGALLSSLVMMLQERHIRAVCTVVLEHTNAPITGRIPNISMEFSIKRGSRQTAQGYRMSGHEGA